MWMSVCVCHFYRHCMTCIQTMRMLKNTKADSEAWHSTRFSIYFFRASLSLHNSRDIIQVALYFISTVAWVFFFGSRYSFRDLVLCLFWLFNYRASCAIQNSFEMQCQWYRKTGTLFFFLHHWGKKKKEMYQHAWQAAAANQGRDKRGAKWNGAQQNNKIKYAVQWGEIILTLVKFDAMQ